MSRNQKAPLLAFVLVALVCCLILVDSRGEAMVSPLSVAPNQLYEHVVPSDRGPSAAEAPAEVPAEASTATSPEVSGEPPDQFDLTSSEGVSGSVTYPDAGDSASGQDQASTAGGLLGSVTVAANDAADAVSGSDPAQDPVIPDPGNGSPGSDGDAPGGGPPSGGPPPGLGHGPAGPKDPSAGLADLGPDGGRPDVHPDEVEPTDEPVAPEAPADAVDESEETLPGAEQPQLRKPHNEARKRDRAKAKGKK